MNKKYLSVILIAIALLIIGYIAWGKDNAPDQSNDPKLSENPTIEQQPAKDPAPIPAPTKPTIPEDSPAVPNKANQDVIDMINAKGSAMVIVSLKGNELTAPENHDDTSKKQAVREIQNRVLATLTPADWSNTTLFDYIPAFAGTLTKSGLDKLNNNPDVNRIEINGQSSVNN